MSSGSGPVFRALGFPSIGSTLGATYVGLVMGAMLFGLTVHQSYRYYKLYPSDKLHIRILVPIILVLETLHTVIWLYLGYHYHVREAFNITGTLHLHWTIPSTFIVTSMAVFACQTFYCFRVFLIGPQYRWLVIPAIASMMIGFSFGVAAGIEAFLFVRELTGLHRVSWMVSVAYGFAVSSDVILTGALVFVLQQSRTQSKRTNSILDTLIIYTINTGLLTSIVSVFAFIFALIIPGNLIYAAMSVIGAKLYANSVLALLNSRRSIDNRFMDDFTTISIPDLSTSEIGSTAQVATRESNRIAWNVRQGSSCMSQTSIRKSVTIVVGTSPYPSSTDVDV